MDVRGYFGELGESSLQLMVFRNIGEALKTLAANPDIHALEKQRGGQRSQRSVDQARFSYAFVSGFINCSSTMVMSSAGSTSIMLTGSLCRTLLWILDDESYTAKPSDKLGGLKVWIVRRGRYGKLCWTKCDRSLKTRPSGPRSGLEASDHVIPDQERVPQWHHSFWPSIISSVLYEVLYGSGKATRTQLP